MSEAPIAPEPGTRPDIVKPIEYQRTPFPTDGRFVQAFLGGHPEIAKTQGLWPDLIEANRGQPEAIMIFPGFNEKHTESIMKGRTVHSLIENLNDTVSFIDWMNLTNIEELIACGLADHFEKNNYKERLFVETDRYMLFRKKNTAHPLIKSHMIRLTSEEKRLIAIFLKKALTE